MQDLRQTPGLSSSVCPALRHVLTVVDRGTGDSADSLHSKLPGSSPRAAGLQRAGPDPEPEPEPAPLSGQVLHPSRGSCSPGSILLPVAGYCRYALLTICI